MYILYIWWKHKHLLNTWWTCVCTDLESQRSGPWKTMLGSFQPSDVFPFFFLPSRAIVLFESDSDKGTLPNFKDKYCCFVRSMVNSFPLPLVSFINGPECHSGWWEVAFWGWFLGREREGEGKGERAHVCGREREDTFYFSAALCYLWIWLLEWPKTPCIYGCSPVGSPIQEEPRSLLMSLNQVNSSPNFLWWKIMFS